MQRTQVKIDVSSIPDSIRNDLAAATLELVREILRHPGGREMLDKKTAERAEYRDFRSPKASVKIEP